VQCVYVYVYECNKTIILNIHENHKMGHTTTAGEFQRTMVSEILYV
jgi:hypothetical protein